VDAQRIAVGEFRLDPLTRVSGGGRGRGAGPPENSPGRRLRRSHAYTRRMVARSLAVALLVVVLQARGAADATQAACPHGSAPLGRVAFVHSRALVVLDLDSCTQRVLVRGIKTPVQIAWSADGKWIAAGNTVVGAGDGRIARPFGRLRREESLGVWASRGHVLAHITPPGGLVLGGPGLRPRRLLPDGWGVSGLMYASDGTLAVSRDLRSGTGVGRPQRQEIWLLRPPTMRPRLLYRVPRGRDTPPQLAAVSTGGRAVFFWPHEQRERLAPANPARDRRWRELWPDRPPVR
jgi:hypothetical protein